MLRGTPQSRTSPFSSTASTTRGFATTTASGSSSNSLLTRPLEPEDVVIEIILDRSKEASSRPARQLVEADAQHVIERSFFIVPLDLRGRPVRRPMRSMKIVLSDISVAVNATPEEGLLFGSSMLKSDEISHVTNWLVENYSLDSLQRMSVQIVQDLEQAQEGDPRTAEAIEQRALVVAEATGRRASDEAASDNQNSGLRRTTRGLPAGRAARRDQLRWQRKATILQEKESIEDTLARFNQKIAMFAVEDPATAEMLMPAKLDLESKLRHLHAQLAAFGDDAVTEPKSLSQSVPEDGISEATSSQLDQFVPEAFAHSEYMDEESSSDDENDLKMALPIDGSEYDVPFISNSSGKTGYVSTDDDCSSFDVDTHSYGSITPPTAKFVIDLSTSKTNMGKDFGDGENCHLDLGSDAADRSCSSDIQSEEIGDMNGSRLTKGDINMPTHRLSKHISRDYSSDLERNTTPRSQRKGRKPFFDSTESADV